MNTEVSRLFREASDLPADRRAGFLDSQTADPSVRREVLSLLAHDELAAPFFADALGSAASSLQSELSLPPGARIGVFEIVRMLGYGGMGAVYFAARADGSFAQKVAIKVIRAGDPAAQVLARFQQERQILARLNHPNIARLLDGGETPAGLPYFVMEYVPGQEIDAYCDKAGLDLPARLRLFLRVAAAVQHAHENLVVHRDLKPGNILVGEDGEPKLLDFGIAKVVDPLSGPAALVSTRLLTPEYASPEQVRGDAITTATDVYCLGGVLYRLLTGMPPHAIAALSPLDTALRIVDQEVPRAANVPSDIAAILEKSLHPDPARRYRSADELSKDILRFLDGKPVLAVSDSFAYRAKKSIRRHWIPVAAIAVVIAALAVGAGVAISQARRAERRFHEVRQLSNKFLFEFEGAIHNVAGATAARELLIKTSQEYLDRLAAEAGGDRDLTRELADAYQKLGNVEGSLAQGNAGDTGAALVSFRKGLELRESLGDSHSSIPKVRVAYLDALQNLSVTENRRGDAAKGMQLAEKAAAISDLWTTAPSAGFDLFQAAASVYANLSARQLDRAQFPSALANAQKSLGLRLRALALDPGNQKNLRQAAMGYWIVAAAESEAGRLTEAVAQWAKVVQMLQQVVDGSPANISSKRDLLAASWQLAKTTGELVREQKKDLKLALPLIDKAYKMAQQLLKEDPGNVLIEEDMAGISLNYGSTLQEAGRPRDALAVLQPAIENQQRRLVTKAKGNRDVAYNLVLLHDWAANCRRDLHDWAGALKERLGLIDQFDRLVAANPSNYNYPRENARNLGKIGDLLTATGDYQGARRYYRSGLEIAGKLRDQDRAQLVAELRLSLDGIAKR